MWVPHLLGIVFLDFCTRIRSICCTKTCQGRIDSSKLPVFWNEFALRSIACVRWAGEVEIKSSCVRYILFHAFMMFWLICDYLYKKNQKNMDMDMVIGQGAR